MKSEKAIKEKILELQDKAYNFAKSASVDGDWTAYHMADAEARALMWVLETKDRYTI